MFFRLDAGEMALLCLGFADKRKLESGSLSFQNPYSVCKYPNAKSGTDLFVRNLDFEAWYD